MTLQVEVTLAGMKTITMGLEFDLTPTQLINFRKYSGKDVANSHGSLSIFAWLELRGFSIAVVRAAIKACSDVHRPTRLE